MDRKQIKKAGRQVFHKHYLILMAVCLLMALFGTEAAQSVQILKLRTTVQTGKEGETVLRADDVFDVLVQGDLTLGESISERIRQNIPAEINNNPALGTTGGVLAGIVSSVMSGQIYLKLAEGIFKATHSASAAGTLLLLLVLLFTLALWFFIRNVFSAMVRRMFLEARTYPKVPFLDLFHCFYVRKWLKACWNMFLYSFFLALWSLTIIGGIIKHYSYYMVPYIIAENPGIKGMEAITLSRKAMKGHKWEAFVFELSFILWHLLALVTFGVSDALYAYPYRMAAKTEYYVYLRKQAKDAGIPGAEALNDTYLYEVGDKIRLYESYFDVVDLQTLVLEEEEKITGVKAFILKWFSIWAGSMEGKKRYERVEGYKYRIQRLVQSRDGLAYPIRLSPLWKERKKITVPFSFLRAYSIWTLVLMFILFCVIGWCWEVCLFLVRDGYFANRGVMHGPWLPVYGSGGIIVLLVCSRFRKNPVVELIVSIALCGVIEYLGAYLLETRYHERWWSYDGCFLNIHGRVCAEGLVVFGIACMLVVYLIAPVFDLLLSKIPGKILAGIAIGVMVVFLIDAVYSHAHPNMAKGAVEERSAGMITETGPGEWIRLAEQGTGRMA